MKIMKNTRLRRMSLSAVLLLALSLSACGSKSSDTSAQNAPAQSTAAAESSTAAETAAPETEASETTTQAPAAETLQETTPAETQMAASENAASSEKDTASAGGSGKTGEAVLGFLSGESGEKAEKEEADVKLPVEGTYTSFGVQNEGYQVTSDSMELESVLVLEEDGTGYMTFDGDQQPITEWTLTEDTIHITMGDGGTADGKLQNGIIELDVLGTGNMFIFFAQDGADTSSYQLMTMDEVLEAMNSGESGIPNKDNGSKLAALWNSMDGSKGIHVHYDMYLKDLDVLQEYDVHVLNGQYYSLRKMDVNGKENRLITYFSGGKAYNLYPDDMTGMVATETSSSIILNNPELMDSLIQDIYVCKQNDVYHEEKLDIGGESYNAEVYDATEIQPEGIFCFNDDGSLAFYLRTENPDSDTPGATDADYTIHAFDDQADASLFDISGYTIK